MPPRKRIACGTSTGYWKNTSDRQHPADERIVLHVNTTEHHFQGIPQYYVTLFGNTAYWMIRTDHVVFNASANGFDVVLQLPANVSVEDLSEGKQLPFADFANFESWGVYWFALESNFMAPVSEEPIQAMIS